MKILSVPQIRQADTYTIEHEPISSDDLMERASAAFSNWFIRCFRVPQTIHIICGTGNNGGDGLCIARQLHARAYSIRVHIVWFNNQPSPDFLLNLKRLEQQGNISLFHLHPNTPLPNIAPTDIVIDAIFGSGLTRSIVDPFCAAIIQHINNSAACAVVAVDMPSGLFADVHTPSTNIVKATHTISFELPKLAFMLPQNAVFVGYWHTLAIGLHPYFIDQAPTNYHYVTPDLVAKWQKTMPKFAHKGTRGHVLVIGGSFGKIGACLLTAKATLHNGAGLVTAYLPQCGYSIIQTAAPEVMALCDPHLHYITQLPDTKRYQAIAIGTGLDTQPITQNALLSLLKTPDVNLVIDADALNLIAQNNWQNYLPPNSILTPHPKEFERLAGSSNNHFERLEQLKHFAQQHQVVVVLKGAHTAIALPNGEVYFNSTGNPAMATAGSGDVLTGFIVALLAQGYLAHQAAILGVYLHGQAGDQAASKKNGKIVAQDIINLD